MNIARKFVVSKEAITITHDLIALLGRYAGKLKKKIKNIANKL